MNLIGFPYLAAPTVDKNIAQNKENFRSPKHLDDLLNKNLQ
jgi:hypothetical protein